MGAPLASCAMSSDEPVVRSGDWVQREYGQEKWPEIGRIVERVCQSESDLPRVLGRVVREENGDEPLGALTFVIGAATVSAAQVTAHGAHQALITETVLQACRDQTQLVVELGSGWGRNLLALWLGGGPRDARYVGAEYTEAGRRVYGRLAELDPAAPARSRYGGTTIGPTSRCWAASMKLSSSPRTVSSRSRA